jgi:hypothetical protein
MVRASRLRRLDALSISSDNVGSYKTIRGENLKPLRALVSSFGSIEEEFQEDHLKLCFLWYDEVLIEYLGPRMENIFVDRLVQRGGLSRNEVKEITDVIFPLTRRFPKREYENLQKKLMVRGYPRWGQGQENYNYPQPKTAEEFAHNMLLQKIESEFGVAKLDEMDVEHAEGRARVAVDAVGLWTVVNVEYPCMLQTTDDEKLALNSALMHVANSTSLPTGLELLKLSVPAMRNVPWQEVIKLKRHGKVSLLRRKLGEVMLATDRNVDAAKGELERLEHEAMEEIIERFRPEFKTVLAETLLASIPTKPFPNPVNAFLHWRDVTRELKKEDQFSWAYLLRDLRSVSKAPPNPGTAT